ncbi:hypothetical protein MKX01_006026, partial [Papaver californicum]
MMSGNICQSSIGEHEVEGNKIRRQETDSRSESNNKDHTKNSYGSTSRPPVHNRSQIIFDKYGRPCDLGSEKFMTTIGKIVRAHCRPAIESWTIFQKASKTTYGITSILTNIKYEVAEMYRHNVLTKASISYRNLKHQLRLELDKYDTIAERKKMPECLIAKRKDWESFVDFCNTDEDKQCRAAGKKAREYVELLQSCGRKGISRTIYDLNPTGEINRCFVFAKTHVTKTINDSDSTFASDVKI